MQTQIDLLNINSLTEISLGTVAGSAVFSGYFITESGAQVPTSFTVTPTQQCWSQIWGNAVNNGVPLTTLNNVLVLKNVPAFYLGTNGNANGYLGPNTNYIQIGSGTWRLCGKGTLQDRVFRNLEALPLEDRVVQVVAGYDGSHIRPLTVDASGNSSVSISGTPSFSVSGVPTITVSGTTRVNTASLYRYSVPSTVQSVSTTPGSVFTNNGSSLGTSMLGVLVANTGTNDAWLSNVSGTYMFIAPAGTSVFVPLLTPIYAVTLSSTASLTITEYGYF